MHLSMAYWLVFIAWFASLFVSIEANFLRTRPQTCDTFWGTDPCAATGRTCHDAADGYVCKKRPQDGSCPFQCGPNARCAKHKAFYVCECLDGFFRLNPTKQCSAGTIKHAPFGSMGGTIVL
jgi:hypothetical protein